MKNLKIKTDKCLSFELTLVTRDASGNATGTRSYETDSAYKLSQFYLRHKGKPKRRKKRVESKETTKIVKQNDITEAYVDTTENQIEQ